MKRSRTTLGHASIRTTSDRYGHLYDAARGRDNQIDPDAPERERGDAMPLSDDERLLLSQIEADLSASDPRLAQQVSDTTLYRHSARVIGRASAGVVAGGVVMLATFTTTLLLEAFGFLVMLARLLVIERHVRRIGRAGLEDVAVSQRISKLRDALMKAMQPRQGRGPEQAPG